MRRKFFPVLCCAILLAACLMPSARAAQDLPVTALVGLYYGNTAMEGANLMNKVGSGFEFGWLDEQRTFQPMGGTTETAISVVKTQNVYYGTSNGYTSYFDHITSNILVGCWHVELEGAYSTFQEAQLHADAAGGFPVWTGSAYLVRIGAYGSREDAQKFADKFSIPVKVVGTSEYGMSVVKTGTAQILFQFDAGSEQALAIQGRETGTERLITYFHGNTYYGGFQYQRVGGRDLTISNFLPMEDYIGCVVSREMSPSWPLEALKAQAVTARTYYQTNLGRHMSNKFDICSTTHCQAYHGTGLIDARTDQAARETVGLRIWYQGELAQAFYFASSGGGTENVQNVWGKSYPYLCGVIDPYEATVSDKIDYWNWHETFTGAQLAEKLQAKGYACAEIVDFQVVERTPTGNVKSIRFVDANGKSWTFYRTDVFGILGLKSIRYTVTPSGEVVFTVYYIDEGEKRTSMEGVNVINGDGTVVPITGTPYVMTGNGLELLTGFSEGTGGDGENTFQVDGSGWGHSVGMSQWGAYAMALQGKTFQEILTFYYPGVEIY